MSAGTLLGWLAALAACAVYLVMASTIAAFGDRVTALRSSRRPAGESQPEPATLYLSSNALILGRGLQGSALLAGTLAVYAGTSVPSDTGWAEAAALAISGALTAGGAAVLQLAAWTAVSHAPLFTRRLLAPVAGGLHAASALSWLAWAGRLSRLGGHDAPPPASPEDDVSAALKENLSLIEDANIPLRNGELQMVRSIFRMDTVKVREIMRPRVDMIAAPADSSVASIVEQLRRGGHSKVPVYEGTLDNVVGVVFARDLLTARQDDGDPSTLVRRLARPPHFVPESQTLERLLQEFQEKRTGIALVIDEYGGVSGLVTVRDLVEDIVGKLVDDSDVEQPGIQRGGDGENIVDAALSIDDLNQALGTAIEPTGFDTVGGLVYRELGKVPAAGDRFRVDGLIFTVESTSGRRVRQVRVASGAPAGEVKYAQPEG